MTSSDQGKLYKNSFSWKRLMSMTIARNRKLIKVNCESLERFGSAASPNAICLLLSLFFRGKVTPVSSVCVYVCLCVCVYLQLCVSVSVAVPVPACARLSGRYKQCTSSGWPLKCCTTCVKRRSCAYPGCSQPASRGEVAVGQRGKVRWRGG